MAVLTLGKIQGCSLCVAPTAEVSVSEDCRGPQWPRQQVSLGLLRAVGDLLVSFSPTGSCCGQGDLSWHQVQLTGVLLIMVVLMSAHGVAMELGSGAQVHTKQLQSWSLKCKHLQSNSGSGVQSICGIRGLWQPWSRGSAAVALSCWGQSNVSLSRGPVAMMAFGESCCCPLQSRPLEFVLMNTYGVLCCESCHGCYCPQLKSLPRSSTEQTTLGTAVVLPHGWYW